MLMQLCAPCWHGDLSPNPQHPRTKLSLRLSEVRQGRVQDGADVILWHRTKEFECKAAGMPFVANVWQQQLRSGYINPFLFTFDGFLCCLPVLC